MYLYYPQHYMVIHMLFLRYLKEFAEANGIELDPKATNAAMIEAITEAFAK